jgi:NAD(P)-dependent dehydrogenase (short-subunit alcohol dehydrogenase family)
MEKDSRVELVEPHGDSRRAQFAGNVALVTGASRGLGRAVARRLASEGARTIVCSRSAADLTRLAHELKADFNADAVVAAADLGSPAAADEVEKKVRRFCARIDILVCCAGASKGGRLDELSEEDWSASFAPKFFGTVALIKRMVPLMRKSGHATIVILTGSQGYEPRAENIIAGAINAALHAVIKSLANDLSGNGIRVLGVSPGPFDTDRMRTVIADRSRSFGITLEEARQRTLAQVPMGRFGTPEELAEIVSFLAGNQARFINGTVVTADGGMRRGF